jgi:hypothetical protein
MKTLVYEGKLTKEMLQNRLRDKSDVLGRTTDFFMNGPLKGTEAI